MGPCCSSSTLPHFIFYPVEGPHSALFSLTDIGSAVLRNFFSISINCQSRACAIHTLCLLERGSRSIYAIHIYAIHTLCLHERGSRSIYAIHIYTTHTLCLHERGSRTLVFPLFLCTKGKSFQTGACHTARMVYDATNDEKAMAAVGEQMHCYSMLLRPL